MRFTVSFDSLSMIGDRVDSVEWNFRMFPWNYFMFFLSPKQFLLNLALVREITQEMDHLWDHQLCNLICMFLYLGMLGIPTLDSFRIPQTKTGSNKVNDSRFWIFWSLYHFIEEQNLKTTSWAKDFEGFKNIEDPEGFYWGGYKAINVNKWHGRGTRCRNFFSS